MRFRFSVRWMMAATAVAALVVLGARRVSDLWKRSSEYQSQADLHDLHRTRALNHAKPRIALLPSHHARDEAKRRLAREAAEWHKRRSQLYKKAVSRPWLRVEDEPIPAPYYLSDAPAGPVAAVRSKPEPPAPPAHPEDDGYRLEWPTRRRESPPPDPKGERSDAGGHTGPNPLRFYVPRPVWRV